MIRCSVIFYFFTGMVVTQVHSLCDNLLSSVHFSHVCYTSSSGKRKMLNAGLNHGVASTCFVVDSLLL